MNEALLVALSLLIGMLVGGFIVYRTYSAALKFQIENTEFWKGQFRASEDNHNTFLRLLTEKYCEQERKKSGEVN